MVDVSATTSERTLWDRSESRQVRPFRYVSGYLEDAAICLYEDGQFTVDESQQIEEVDLSRLAISIRVSKPPAVFEDLVGASADELRFITIVEDRFLKRSSVVLDCRFNDINGDLINLGDCAKEAASWRGETRIHLAVILGQDRDAKTGFAKREGSWLARKSFRITKPANTAIFPIKPVSRDWFRARRLPESTTYLVDFNSEDLNQPSAELPNLLEIYVSEEVVAAMAVNPSSAVNRVLAKSIYADIVKTVLMTGIANLAGDPSPNSIMDVIISPLSGATGIARDRILMLARETSDGEIRAIVQAEAELTRAITDATRRRMA